VRRRAEREQVEDERLVVAFPAIGKKAVLGPPAVAERLSPGEHPRPVDAFVQHPAGRADLALGRVAPSKNDIAASTPPIRSAVSTLESSLRQARRPLSMSRKW
jgi:hypothetical protein